MRVLVDAPTRRVVIVGASLAGLRTTESLRTNGFTESSGSTGSSSKRRCHPSRSWLHPAQKAAPPDAMSEWSRCLVRLAVMKPQAPWFVRAWLPYLLVGVGWVAYGSAVLGEPQGLGVIFIGLSCLSIGGWGAGWRMLNRNGPRHEPPSR